MSIYGEKMEHKNKLEGIIKIVDLVGYQDGAIVSRTILDKKMVLL